MDTMLNVATHTLRGRRSFAVDKNKPREAPARPTNANGSSQVAPAGGTNQNQLQPPPDLVGGRFKMAHFMNLSNFYKLIC